MKTLNSIFRIGNGVFRLLSVILALLLIAYSAYVIYDNLYLEQSAFKTRELSQYVKALNADGSLNFAELIKINPDTVGWIRIFDTNIDYPVVQGENDHEYLNKDVFGNGNLAGSIYLSAENSGEFVENYSVIYGHHMNNGAMFGDIDKFFDREFFENHISGAVEARNGKFELRVFAAMHASAYDRMIYKVNSAGREDYPEILEYLKNNADIYMHEGGEISKIFVFSTCDGYNLTNGRLLLFAEAIPNTQIVVHSAEEVADAVNENNAALEESNSAVFVLNSKGASHWAVLNLVCVILTVLVLVPLLRSRKKYRQIGYSRKTANGLEHPEDDEKMQRIISQNDPSFIEKLIKDLKNFVKKAYIGIILEAAIAIVSIIVFILTENMTLPITVIDKWTPLMIIIFALALFADYICFRYRGERVPGDDDNNNDINDGTDEKGLTGAVNEI